MSNPASPLATPSAWESAAAGHVAPLFEHFAKEAVRLADLPPTGRVLDIACGAGTVSLLAASRAAHVDAVDFAPAVIEHLRRRLAEAGITNVTPRVADAQALPFEDNRYAAAIAMFALAFFPDRPRGFREIWRVLEPGGRAVVSSWAPMDKDPALAAMLGAMNDEIPGLVESPARLPLSDPTDFRAEMETAGFQNVAVHTVTHRGSADSPHAFWWSNATSSALIVLLRRELGEPDFAAFSAGVLIRLTRSLGPGRVEWDSVAYLGVGHK